MLHEFSLDPVAEFLAAEAYFDCYVGDGDCLKDLIAGSKESERFHNALLLTIQARQKESRQR